MIARKINGHLGCPMSNKIFLAKSEMTLLLKISVLLPKLSKVLSHILIILLFFCNCCSFKISIFFDEFYIIYNSVNAFKCSFTSYAYILLYVKYM